LATGKGLTGDQLQGSIGTGAGHRAAMALDREMKKIMTSKKIKKRIFLKKKDGFTGLLLHADKFVKIRML